MNLSFFKLNFVFLFLSFSLIGQEEEMDLAPQNVYDTDTIVWFGADFSFFRLSDEKKMGQDEKLIDYIFAWNEEFKSGLSNVKIASLLEKKKVINDKTFTDGISEKFTVRPWIVSGKHSVGMDVIEAHLGDIESDNKGLGLIYMVVNFYKSLPSDVHGYFVWFDIKTKEVYHIYESSGYPNTDHSSGTNVKFQSKRLPASQGMTGYWYRGMIDAAVEFADDYKKGIIREEKQY